MNSLKKYNTGFDAEVTAIVKEVAAVYKINSTTKKISYNDFLSNKMLIVHSIRKGISFSFFNKIKNNSPFTDIEWADFLNISTKSLQRYKNEKRFVFKPIHSEKIIELAEVTNFGNSVFDTTKDFYSWLNTTSIALGSMKPLELLKNSYGKEMVMEELNRIDQGVFV
ncbi:MAG TPA: antitoxin [Flavobacteriaceae bacterium]|jgi:putative toxin-antitoxin system antitoxin component (TIGR02293 family)|nr:antitoxin [Flavobacteriaceae bacterium]HBS11925.1 antitoxin [Flavobacteriaceae bacterium]